MLSGKDFVSRNLFGERFDKNVYRNGFDINYAKRGLSSSGKNLIEKFILQNKFKSDIMKQRDEEFKIKKRALWKYGYNNKNEFGPLLVDKEYIFDKPKEKKYGINQPPFRRPKEEGDYFDKDIHILGGNLLNNF